METKLNDGFKEISTSISWWKPTAGDSLIGVLGSIEIVDKDGKRITRRIIDSDGIRYGLPDHTVLMNALNQVSDGNLIQVICTHVGSGRKDPYLYKIGISTEQENLPF